jgi:hypothetical protein
VYVRFRSPSLLSSEAIDGRRRFPDERRQQSSTRVLCLSALGYRLMQLAAKRMKDYIDLARRPFLYFFGDWLHIRCPQGRGQDPVRRDEKTKSVVKSVVTRPANQPPIQPTKPTNQSKTVGPRVGSKESTKRRQVRKPFFLGPNLSFIRQGVPLRLD